MPQIQVVARETLAVGREEETQALYRLLAEAVMAEPGNVFFQVYRQLDNPREIILYERYTSREAYDAHRETAHFKEYVVERIIPLLEGHSMEVFEASE
jgi:quinol monooxygenase YgiN